MLFIALGATDAVGASCHFLKIDGTGLVLDAGVDPEEGGPASLPRFEIIHDHAGWYVDHAIITHAHHDHIGALPVLIREFPHVQVHMTRATRDLAEFTLPASARLQARKLKEGSSSHEPLFHEKDLEYQSYLYLTHELETPFDVSGLRAETPVTAELYTAGHILGSAGVLLTFEEDGAERRVFYTSDTNLRPQTIIPGGSYPAPPVDVLILESTLGADPEAEQTTRKQEERKFREALQRILGRGGTALVPVFALGRAQEMLAVIDRFKERGQIPEDVPVYTAGSLRAIADLYDKSRHFTPRRDPDFQVFGVDQKRLPRSNSGKRGALDGPSIHVVSSGMMFERTLSNWIAQQIVDDKDSGILLVGFAKEDTPAARLREAAAAQNGSDMTQEVILDPEKGPQPVKCEVHRFRFSGHSHRRDLIQLVEQLQPKKVLLVHGEAEAREWMEDNIQFFYPDVEVIRPQLGEPLEV
ncbi:MAG: MBL fold metallo-hydrolase [Bacteroidetes bacterium]|jgi:Cft2 family RNA processing exonuclease|nr:MBL fold metallo-hydrolase [Bacteroidota bacterium]